jgi:hypothetical protein
MMEWLPSEAKSNAHANLAARASKEKTFSSMRQSMPSDSTKFLRPATQRPQSLRFLCVEVGNALLSGHATLTTADCGRARLHMPNVEPITPRWFFDHLVRHGASLSVHRETKNRVQSGTRLRGVLLFKRSFAARTSHRADYPAQATVATPPLGWQTLIGSFLMLKIS